MGEKYISPTTNRELPSEFFINLFLKKDKRNKKRADSHLKKALSPLKKEKSRSKTVFCWASNRFPPCSRFSSAVQQKFFRRAADCKERPATHQTQREEWKSGRKRENPEKEGKNMQKVKNPTINPACSKRNRPFLASYSHFYPLNELPKGQKRHIFICKRKNVKSEIRTNIWMMR